MSEAVVVALVGLVAGVTGSLLTLWGQRRKVNSEAEKNEADTNEQIRKTVMSLIQPLKDTISDLQAERESDKKEIDELKQQREVDKKEMDALRMQVVKFKDWAYRLVDQLKGMGCEPVPFEVKSKGE